MLGHLASPCSVATRDSLSKLSLSARCSRAFHTLACIFLSFKHLHSPLWLRRRLAAARHSWKQVFALLSPCTIFARVCRTEIYCAIVRKLSQPTTNRVPSNLFEWPRCEGGRFTKLIYRTPIKNIGLLWAKVRMFCIESTDVCLKEVRCFYFPCKICKKTGKKGPGILPIA